MNLQKFLSPGAPEFLISWAIAVLLIFSLFTLPVVVQYIRMLRKSRKKKRPIPELSDEGKGLVGVMGGTAIFLGFIITLVFSSCSPQIRGLHTEGHIIKAEPDRIFVLFEDAMGRPGHYSGNWFYVPGASYLNIEAYKVKVELQEIKP